MNKSLLVVVQHIDDCYRVAKLVDALFDNMTESHSFGNKAREQFIDFPNGSRVIVASVEYWNDSITCGRNFDKVIFLCKPPDYVIEQVKHCLVFSEEEERIVK